LERTRVKFPAQEREHAEFLHKAAKNPACREGRGEMVKG